MRTTSCSLPRGELVAATSAPLGSALSSTTRFSSSTAMALKIPQGGANLFKEGYNASRPPSLSLVAPLLISSGTTLPSTHPLELDAPGHATRAPRLTQIPPATDALWHRGGRHPVRLSLPLRSLSRPRACRADPCHAPQCSNIHAVAELAEIVRTCVPPTSRLPRLDHDELTRRNASLSLLTARSVRSRSRSVSLSPPPRS